MSEKKKTFDEVDLEVYRPEKRKLLEPRRDALFIAGAYHALDHIEQMSRLARARLLSEFKEQELFRQTGMSYEKSVRYYFGISQQQADHEISRIKEYGETYFQIARFTNGLSDSTFERMKIDRAAKTIEHEGRVISIDESNADEIAEIAKQCQTEKRRADKMKAERDGAVAQAKKLREDKLRDDKQPELAWQGADEDHRALIQMEQERDYLLTRLEMFSHRDLSTQNQSRLVGFCEATWWETHQVTEKIRGRHGVGMCQVVPSSTVEIDELTPNKIGLVEEHRKTHPLVIPDHLKHKYQGN